MPVYYSNQEHDLIREAAMYSGQSVSAWVRSVTIAAARKLRRLEREDFAPLNGRALDVDE